MAVPARALHLELLSHLGARPIRERTAYAEPIGPERSTCAGADPGIEFGRVALYDVLKNVSGKFKQVLIRSQVDDVAARIESSKKEVIKQLSNAGVDFAAGAKRAKLAMSTKPTAIGNDMEVVKEVALKLQHRGASQGAGARPRGRPRQRSAGQGQARQEGRSCRSTCHRGCENATQWAT